MKKILFLSIALSILFLIKTVSATDWIILPSTSNLFCNNTTSTLNPNCANATTSWDSAQYWTFPEISNPIDRVCSNFGGSPDVLTTTEWPYIYFADNVVGTHSGNQFIYFGNVNCDIPVDVGSYVKTASEITPDILIITNPAQDSFVYRTYNMVSYTWDIDTTSTAPIDFVFYLSTSTYPNDIFSIASEENVGDLSGSGTSIFLKSIGNAIPDGSTSTLIYLRGEIYLGGQIISSQELTFTVYRYTTDTELEETDLFILEECVSGGIFSSSSLDSIFCNIRNGVRTIGNVLNNSIKASFNWIVNAFLNIFPINIFSHVNNAFIITRANATSSIPIVFGGNGTFGGRYYTILDNDTLNNESAKFGFDYRSLLDKIMYLVVGGLMIFQTILVIQHLKKDKQYD